MSPIDMERISIIAENDEEKKMIISVFFRIAEELIHTMENTMRADAYQQWKSSAHSLKGAAANLGMDALVDKCLKAEKCDTGGVAKRRFLLEDIRGEVQAIREHLAHYYPSVMVA